MAEACTGHECALDETRVIVKYAPNAWLWWRPDAELPQKDALVCKVAQLIEATDPDNTPNFWQVVHQMDLRLRSAIADNNTSALEFLCFELLRRC